MGTPVYDTHGLLVVIGGEMVGAMPLPRLKVMWDWDAFPLWLEHGDMFRMVTARTVGLSSEPEASLQAWADEAEQRSPYVESDSTDWDRHGRALADLVRPELRGRYLVGYVNRDTNTFEWD